MSSRLPLLAQTGPASRSDECPLLREQQTPVFEHACKIGHEAIVSKHRDRAYRAGRSSNRIEVKNPASAAMLRAEDGSW